MAAHIVHMCISSGGSQGFIGCNLWVNVRTMRTSELLHSVLCNVRYDCTWFYVPSVAVCLIARGLIAMKWRDHKNALHILILLYPLSAKVTFQSYVLYVARSSRLYSEMFLLALIAVCLVTNKQAYMLRRHCSDTPFDLTPACVSRVYKVHEIIGLSLFIISIIE